MQFAPYDQLAQEYYDPFHKTCRNFDQTTSNAIKKTRSRVPKKGMLLDVGSGRGRCVEFLGVEPNRVVQLDNSRAMLELSPREECLFRILHDAERLPFLDESFSCVAAFLCDPYLGLNFLTDSFRVLEVGGIFVATTPAFEWGTALRKELCIDSSETRFKTLAGPELRVPSVLVSAEHLLSMLVRAGFDKTSVSIEKHSLPSKSEPVSEDVITSAQHLDVSIHELDLIYLVVATK